ncbi:hypothetical protein GCM10012320_31510 [Sinomonas cellulolyticus]|uniref:Matrixin family metalloprotease n=1 Tax=Sinomonas cellulolyticus TaxID=2801916 RepID=A0ABS1JY53_9MICC|nr:MULTISPECIES: matrixin family metalloprotease [Sinomonas]MBL0704169.1 matrixin family metalloprotease [Sinomonas cellulolyticus]GHG58073.1 hypothetical protein GCM10012320_31510 [Sinomonas sp. KCTC 49339]
MDDDDRPLPRASDGHIPQWAIDEEARRVLAGLDRGLPRDLVRAAKPPRRRRRLIAGRGGMARTVVVLAVLTGLLSSSLWLRWVLPGHAPAIGSDSIGSLMGVHPDGPTPGFEEGPRPVQVVAMPREDGPHTFLVTRSDDGPAGYSPCRPLHYTVNPAGAPPGAVELVDRAASRIAAASGFLLRRDSPTDETASFDRPAYQPKRYGDRWAPVVVGFSTPEQTPRLAGKTAGLGGSAAIERPGTEPALVTGAIVLDAPDLSSVLARPGGAALAEAIVLHEFGHVMGLGHVSAAGELMAESNTGQLDLGPGDRAGLAEISAAPCRPDL